MNRFVSLLLIPIFMLGHVLPHSHAGTSVGEPDGHSLRPHFHVSADHHHHHDDHDHKHRLADERPGAEQCTPTTALSVPIDHDSDAVYLSDSDWMVSRTVAVPQADLEALDWTSFAPAVDRESRPCKQIGAPSGSYAGLPIYLLTASLRL